MVRAMDLEGKWLLEEIVDSEVDFLYGARYWVPVKKSVIAHAERYDKPEGKDLEQRIREVAAEVAASEKVEASVVLGISAVSFMALQQMGLEGLTKVADQAATHSWGSDSPDHVVKRRERSSAGLISLMSFLKGAGQSHRVVWDEKKTEAVFWARHGQDLAMAAATDTRDYRAMDYRCIEGPIPVECRVASCGYCWVGVISGRENLSEISSFERERLHYFGYDAVNDPADPHPLIRLACQTQCVGDVTLVTPPWNGELERRHHRSRDDLGTA
jgi:ferredoxin